MKVYFKNTIYYSFCIIFFITGILACKKQTVFSNAKAEVLLYASDERFKLPKIVLSADTVYTIAANIIIDSGKTLDIKAGTLIKVNDKISITIKPGAIINAMGTAILPIVFTSAAYKAGAGVGNNSGFVNNWNGIEIMGQPGKSSGTVKYVRIEFAGLVDDDKSASLKLNKVDSLTNLSNIMVSYSKKCNGFIFSGGNVSATKLISFAANSSDFVFTGGFKGSMQNLLAYRLPYFPNQGVGENLAGILINGETTSAIISNASVIGPDLKDGTSSYYSDTSIPAKPPFGSANIQRRAGIVAISGCTFNVANTAVVGFPKAGIYIDDKKTAANLANGLSTITYSFLHANDINRVCYIPSNVYPPYTAKELKEFLLQPKFSNAVLPGSDAFMFSDAFRYELPNVLPKPGSPLLAKADFNNPIFNNNFFNKVTYVGAFGADNWMLGWTNFTPLQTNYNN